MNETCEGTMNAETLARMTGDEWRAKAHRLIANLCHASWASANRIANGRIRKKHTPYSVPELAQQLIDCLNRNAEAEAKALFLSYDGLRALGE